MPKRRNEDAPYWQQLRTAERHMIEYALEHGQTVRGTAAILGVSSNYLGERMRDLGIPAPEVRPGPKPGTKPKRSTPRATVTSPRSENVAPTLVLDERELEDEDEELEDEELEDEDEGEDDATSAHEIGN